MKQTFKSNPLGDYDYGKPFAQYPEGPATDRVFQEYDSNRSEYKALRKLKGNLRKALRGESGSQFEGQKHALAQPLYVMSVASIQTPTPTWESATVEWLNGEKSLRDYLQACEDTPRKLTCIQRVMDTDLLERVNNALRGHHLVEAVRLLSGEKHGIRTYLRGAKAWFPVSFMFHVGCIDTNVHTAMRPILMHNVENEPIFHPSMDDRQKGQAIERAETWENGKIPPFHHDWINKRVSEYGKQDEIKAMWELMDIVFNGIPKEVLPQVLFNVGGMENGSELTFKRTIHLDIFEALGENLEEYEE